MPDPAPAPQKSAQEKLQELMERVRTMPRGGDLEGLLVREMAELTQLIQQQALTARDTPDASSQASFPPSGKPSQ